MWDDNTVSDDKMGSVTVKLANTTVSTYHLDVIIFTFKLQGTQQTEALKGGGTVTFAAKCDASRLSKLKAQQVSLRLRMQS